MSKVQQLSNAVVEVQDGTTTDVSTENGGETTVQENATAIPAEAANADAAAISGGGLPIITPTPTAEPETSEAAPAAEEEGAEVLEAEESAEETEGEIETTGEETETTSTVGIEADAGAESSGVSSVLIVSIVLVVLAVALAAVAMIMRGRGKRRGGSSGRSPRGGRSGNARANNAVNPTIPEGAADGYSFGYAQTIGRRENQEDSYCISRLETSTFRSRGLLAAVADGIGGLNNGQVASGTAMRNMAMRFEQQDPERPSSDRLLELAAQAQEDVASINRQNGDHCGTTLVSVLITPEGMVFLSVGDSRIVLYRSGVLMQLNREHVLGKESDEAVALNGAAPRAEGSKRNAITAYLGRENLRQMDRNLRPMPLVPGDRVLLMSDGVFNALSDAEIMAHLGKSPRQAAQAIVEAVDAKAFPHQDNATIVIVGLD